MNKPQYKTVYFEQPCKLHSGQVPKTYFDPATMFATEKFSILPGEEILVIICGAGYNFADDLVHGLYPRGSEKNPKITTCHQLCYLIRNTSNTFTIYVGLKCNLLWLLDMPKITSKLCYSSYEEINALKADAQSFQNDTSQTSDSNLPIVYDETILIAASKL